MKIEKQYITIEELSEMLSVKKGTLYDWVHNKKIPHSKLGSKNLRGKGTLRFKISDIEAWLKSKTYKVKRRVDGL